MWGFILSGLRLYSLVTCNIRARSLRENYTPGRITVEAIDSNFRFYCTPTASFLYDTTCWKQKRPPKKQEMRHIRVFEIEKIAQILALLIASNLIFAVLKARQTLRNMFLLRGMRKDRDSVFNKACFIFFLFILYYSFERNGKLSHSNISTKWGEAPLSPLQFIVKACLVDKRNIHFFTF